MKWRQLKARGSRRETNYAVAPTALGSIHARDLNNRCRKVQFLWRHMVGSLCFIFFKKF
jgi:hypothetical protein